MKYINIVSIMSVLFTFFVSPAAARSIPWNEQPPVLRDLICINNPLDKRCECPPLCLSTMDENRFSFETSVRENAAEAGLKSRISDKKTLVFRSPDNSTSTITCNPQPIPEAQRRGTHAQYYVMCNAKLNEATYKWTTTYNQLSLGRGRR